MLLQKTVHQQVRVYLQAVVTIEWIMRMMNPLPPPNDMTGDNYIEGGR